MGFMGMHMWSIIHISIDINTNSPLDCLLYYWIIHHRLLNLLLSFAQNTHSNGQPVTVSQEEVKVTEAVSKLSPQIKTEKVRLCSCVQEDPKLLVVVCRQSSHYFA